MFDLDFLICTRLIKVIGNIRIIVCAISWHSCHLIFNCLSCLAQYNIFCVDDNTNGLCKENQHGWWMHQTRCSILLLFPPLNYLKTKTKQNKTKNTRLFIKSQHLQSLLLCFKKPDVLNVVLHGILVSFHFLLCLNFKLCPFSYLVPLSWFSHHYFLQSIPNNSIKWILN